MTFGRFAALPDYFANLSLQPAMREKPRRPLTSTFKLYKNLFLDFSKPQFSCRSDSARHSNSFMIFTSGNAVEWSAQLSASRCDAFFRSGYCPYPWCASFSMLCTRQYRCHCVFTFSCPRSVKRSSFLLWRKLPNTGSTVAILCP